MFFTGTGQEVNCCVYVDIESPRYVNTGTGSKKRFLLR